MNLEYLVGQTFEVDFNCGLCNGLITASVAVLGLKDLKISEKMTGKEYSTSLKLPLNNISNPAIIAVEVVEAHGLNVHNRANFKVGLPE
ncbi:hypothetical protein A2954_01350 [Candidatus Roizmanbacteria bacterium RIFCSPLOWO2_01_FULL_37_12]|uniref:Uncharacterized protein n=1 Tax=Candidatus Roizmanbacteria bacterium RIFCSPLOWO2_01_FULL_37_12 TaxID=1802056 RepID=A0A1F7IGJ5_9BACT|nr:MAG: hypothetical protein A3D76_05940 [Candidatus Roizmanbacteria bacterium RIFCSPHIGHO2_02_FULL_37_9b]OGK42471.1 MAG: hypothetical protein A2954_01350 [Candidatus Roizmanbacteria bacterium RIFCSPLOWO2_01_FULL_37_12]